MSPLLGVWNLASAFFFPTVLQREEYDQLIEMCRNGNLAAVQNLLGGKTLADPQRDQCILSAAATGQLGVIEYLLKERPVSDEGVFIVAAAGRGQHVVVDFFCRRGALAADILNCALGFAVERNCGEENQTVRLEEALLTIDTLLKYGSPTTGSDLCFILLHCNDLEIAQRLLNSSILAALKMKPEDQQSLILTAASFGCMESLEWMECVSEWPITEDTRSAATENAGKKGKCTEEQRAEIQAFLKTFEVIAPLPNLH